MEQGEVEVDDDGATELTVTGVKIKPEMKRAAQAAEGAESMDDDDKDA